MEAFFIMRFTLYSFLIAMHVKCPSLANFPVVKFATTAKITYICKISKHNSLIDKSHEAIQTFSYIPTGHDGLHN